jgi:wyosine [tRNA(Phe)-imidazoG37] synthetase (radical SAM superfamily)
MLQYVWDFISGVPGVLPERFAEGMDVKHCALSLVGEPIMYPEISNFVHLLHERGISTFLVTNAQFPKELRYLVLILVEDIALCLQYNIKMKHNMYCVCHNYLLLYYFKCWRLVLA